MAKRSYRWTAPEPFDSNLVARTAAYLAIHPGYYLTQTLRSVLLDSYSGATKPACRRLALMGYVETKVGCLSVGSERWERYPSVEFPSDPQGIADDRLVVVYGGTQKLYDEYRSGALADRLVLQRQARAAVPVNERLIRKLIELHPREITIQQLKAVTESSESRPDLARRLDHLAALDWVNIEKTAQPHWAHDQPYYRAHEWTVKLSAGGWLRVQRATSDGKDIVIPKPKKKPKKKEEPAAV